MCKLKQKRLKGMRDEMNETGLEARFSRSERRIGSRGEMRFGGDEGSFGRVTDLFG